MKKKTNIRDIVKDFLEGGEVLTEAPVDAQKVMQDFMAQKYGKKAIVGSDEWNAEQARREAEKEKAAAEAQEAHEKAMAEASEQAKEAVTAGITEALKEGEAKEKALIEELDEVKAEEEETIKEMKEQI